MERMSAALVAEGEQGVSAESSARSASELHSSSSLSSTSIYHCRYF